MEIWFEFLIGILAFLAIWIIIDYLKFTFLFSESRRKKLKRGSKEELGLYFYIRQIELNKIIRMFFKDTVFVLFDTLILGALIITFLERNFLYLFYLLLARLILFKLFKDVKIPKREISEKIEKDLENFRKFLKENKCMNNLIDMKNKQEFYKKLKKIIQKYHFKIPKIKFKKDNKHFFIKASMIPLSNSITYTTRAWSILNTEEKLSVTLHEIWHIHSKIKLLYAIPFLIWVSFIYYASFYLPPVILFLLNIFFLFARIPFFALFCFISQFDEFSADKFSAKNIDKKFLKAAINKASEEKNLPYIKTIDKVFIWPFKTHPSNKERITRLDRI